MGLRLKQHMTRCLVQDAFKCFLFLLVQESSTPYPLLQIPASNRPSARTALGSNNHVERERMPNILKNGSGQHGSIKHVLQHLFLNNQWPQRRELSPSQPIKITAVHVEVILLSKNDAPNFFALRHFRNKWSFVFLSLARIRNGYAQAR